jgi:tetratricopeptide (TPR) repeat protein
MSIHNSCCVFLLTFAFATFAIVVRSPGQDRVRTPSGTVVGEVVETSPTEVSVSKGSTGTETVPVNEIRSITFKSEPNELTQARVNAKNGGFRNALDRLEDIDISKLDRDFIRQEVEFYRAYCAAQLALLGTGKVKDVGPQMLRFRNAHPNSYHYYQARETLGDLFVAANKLANAEKEYAALEKAPWPGYQARGKLLIGRALQGQGKHPEAIQKFDAVLATARPGKDGKAARLAATLGKAISASKTGQLDQGVTMIQDVIRDADPEDSELHAIAYNALGQCYEQADKPKEALLAFLHVDVLYSSIPAAHAEALEHLAALWTSFGQNGRAREARGLLRDQYGRE